MTVDIEKRARELHAKIFGGLDGFDCDREDIAAALRQARDEAIEDCAKATEKFWGYGTYGISSGHMYNDLAESIAKDIRALKVGQSHSTDGAP